MARSHGWTRNNSDWFKEKMKKENNVNDFYNIYTFYTLAYNLRPTEISGFLGNIQIQYWDEIVSKREQNFKIFNDAIEKNSDIFSLNIKHMDTISNFGMPLVFKKFKRFCMRPEDVSTSLKIITPIIII